MANMQKAFEQFWKQIDLPQNKENELREKRECIKREIIEYFSHKEEYNQPEFLLQGSMDMHTTIKPLNEEYDIDYGIYIKQKEIDYNCEETWTDINTLHEMVAEACNPSKRNVDTSKDTCVRVIYANNYHVDFPIYIKNWEDDNFIPRLAHKNTGWIKSDAKANTYYFQDCNKSTDDALRYVVMYLKAMVDYQNYCKNGIKTDISGFELTMLACRDFTTNKPMRIDMIWHKTIEEMYKQCNNSAALTKPVTNDELWRNKSQKDKDSFMKLLKFAKENTRKAIESSSEHDASTYYREIFGDRFPLEDDAEPENKGESVVVESATAG